MSQLHSLSRTAPISAPAPAPTASTTLTGIFSHDPGTAGGYAVSNALGRVDIIATTAQAKLDLANLVSSKAALVQVEGERKSYADPTTGGTREVIEATKVFRAGTGSAAVTGQLVNGASMVFVQGSEGRMPVFGATKEAQAALARFQSGVGVGDTQLARLVGELSGGAFQAQKVELFERRRTIPGPALAVAPRPGLMGMPSVGRPRTAAVTRPAPATDVRPAAVRRTDELAVAWRLVEALERNGNVKGALSEVGGKTDAAWPQNRADFVNFVREGQSSLTPYEARALANGLGFTVSDGAGRAGSLVAGDRVQFTAYGNGATEAGKGIVLDHRTLLVADVHNVSVRYVNEGTDHFCRIDRVTAGALIDGR